MCEEANLRNTPRFLLFHCCLQESFSIMADSFSRRILKGLCLQVHTLAFQQFRSVLVLFHSSMFPIHLNPFLFLHLEKGTLQDGA